MRQTMPTIATCRSLRPATRSRRRWGRFTRVLYEMKRENEDIAQKAFKDVLELVGKDNTAFSQAGGEEYLAFHLITETMLQKGGQDWDNWFPALRDKIIAVQNADGSWTGHHCITSRTFCTAAAILVLTSPNRYLPILQEGKIEGFRKANRE